MTRDGAPPPASLLPPGAWRSVSRTGGRLVEARPWGRISWRADGRPIDVVVRRPGRRLNPWPTVGGSAAAVASWGAAAVGAPEAGALTLVGVVLAGGAAAAWRAQTSRGRRLTGPDLAYGLLRDADITRIARRHGGRHPELRAAAARSGELLWTLASNDLTPAERRRARAAHEADAALALQADEHLVALGDDPVVATASAGDDLGALVAALAAARAELDGRDA